MLAVNVLTVGCCRLEWSEFDRGALALVRMVRRLLEYFVGWDVTDEERNVVDDEGLDRVVEIDLKSDIEDLDIVCILGFSCRLVSSLLLLLLLT